MPKDILIRSVDDVDLEWIASARPPGWSQERFVKSVLSEARASAVGDPLAKRRMKRQPSAFRFIDLFAGIGGFHIGMAANGGECVFTSEWDKWASTTYKAWFGTSQVRSDDVRDLDFSAEIPDHDILCAGFPCQPFSIAGVSKKNSLGRAHGFDDVRQGNLFFAICAIVEAKRPPVLLLENVKNLRSHDGGNTFRVIQEHIDDLGYEMHSQVIDAQAWVPQHRERIFMVCFDREAFSPEEIASFRFPRPPAIGPNLGLILEEEPDPKYMLTDRLWAYLQMYAEKHQAKGNGFGFGLVGPDDVTRTMSARYYKDGSEILISHPGWRNPRRLTIVEASRLMGFNPKYAKRFGHSGGFPQVVSDTQAYKQFGNSVAPPVVEAVGRSITKVMKMRAQRQAA